MNDNRWTKSITDWHPYGEKRSRKRPDTRWRDEIGKFSGVAWQRLAQDGQLWKESGKCVCVCDMNLRLHQWRFQCFVPARAKIRPNKHEDGQRAYSMHSLVYDMRKKEKEKKKERKDEIEKFADVAWQRLAQDGQLWKKLGKVFVQQWTHNGCCCCC